MDLEIKWLQPDPLIDGKNKNLIYDISDLDEWENYPAVYMFCRKYGDKLIPLYIGRTLKVYDRIKQHLNTTKMMLSIKNSQNGERVLVVGEFIAKSGQNVERSLRIIESALIEHALAEGCELINKSGTKTPVHTIQYSGLKAAKDFTGAKMYAKSQR